MLIHVKNNGNTEFSSPYGGRKYHFPPGEIVGIDLPVAKHIFGFGLANKDEVLARHGWMLHGGQREEAMAKLNGFSFEIPEVVPNGDMDTQPKLVAKEQGSAPLQDGEGAEAKAGVPDPLLGKIAKRKVAKQ